MRYVTFLYKIWYYTDKAEFFYTRNADEFYNKLNELEAAGIYNYYFETERELDYKIK